MTATLKEHGHYVILPSPHAHCYRLLDVVRSGSALAGGRPEWIPVGISQKPTQLPEQAHFGDITRMVFTPFTRGWLVTPAVPKNEFWEFFSQGMLGPAMDLVLPGTNAVVGSLIHGGIETAMEENENSKYLRRTLESFFSLPYLDIVEIDWREMGSFWSLSLQGPVRHLTIVYTDTQDQRLTMTLVGGFTFKNWVKQLLNGRYLSEVEAEHTAVMDSFVKPHAYDELLAVFAKQHPDDATPEDLGNLMQEMGRFRAQHLIEQGVTDEMVRTQTFERSKALLERYRGLPGLDEFMTNFVAQATSST